jgi:hypothetical protein
MRRKILIGLAAVIAVLGIAAVVGLSQVDLNRFRARIEAAAEVATGRDLIIAGDVTFALGRPLRLSIDDVTLANWPTGSQPVMARLGHAEVDVHLLPLLSGEVRLGTLVIDDFDVLLETDAAGARNWEFAKPAAERDAAAARPSAEGPASRPFPRIEAVSLRNIRIRYRDDRTAAETSVAVDALSLKVSDPDAPIAFDLKARLNGTPVAATGNLSPLHDLLSVEPIAIADLALGLGSSDVGGKIALERKGPRPRIVATLASATIKLPLFAPVAGGGESPRAGTPGQTEGGSERVIPDDALPFAPLTLVDARIDAAIEQLVLPSGQALQSVRITGDIEAGHANARGSAALTTGSIEASADVDGPRKAVSAALTMTGADLGDAVTVMAGSALIEGGRLDAEISFRGTGATAHQLAASADSEVLIEAAGGRLTSMAMVLAGGDVLKQLFDILRPSTAREDQARIDCAVVRAGVRSGIAVFERGLALETGVMTASGSGQIDLGEERLDLVLRAAPREGLGLSAARIAASLIHVGGTLARPSITLDPIHAADSTLRLGTGVVSGLAQALSSGRLKDLREILEGDPTPCRTARHPHAARSERDPTTKERADELIEGVGRGLKGLFGR